MVGINDRKTRNSSSVNLHPSATTRTESFRVIRSEPTAMVGGGILGDGLREDGASGTVQTPWRTLLTLLGRWMQENPIGFDAGDGDLYRYVGNDPTNATDPSGLTWGCGDWFWFGVYVGTGGTNTELGRQLLLNAATPPAAAAPAPAPAPAGHLGADESGLPSLPPEASETQKKEAIKWIKENFPKVPDKSYTVQGPVGNMLENNWNCAGLLTGTLSPGFDWTKTFPITTLPLNKVKFEEIDREIKNLGDFKQIEDGNLKLEDGKQKTAVLGTKHGDDMFTPQHYLLQLPNGKWIGKLGTNGPAIVSDDLKLFTEDSKNYGQLIAVYGRPNPAYKNK